MRHTRMYRHGVLEAKDFPAAQISDYLDEPETVVWLDLCEPDQADLEVISAEFGLHPLAVEDAVQQHERPKLDRYQDHAFLTAYAVGLDTATGKLKTSELAAFVTGRALITVRKDTGFDIDGVVARWDGSADLAVHGVGFLLWGLLDFVVDGHFATVQRLDEAIESLEDLLFDARPHGTEVQRRCDFTSQQRAIFASILAGLDRSAGAERRPCGTRGSIREPGRPGLPPWTVPESSIHQFSLRRAPGQPAGVISHPASVGRSEQLGRARAERPLKTDGPFAECRTSPLWVRTARRVRWTTAVVQGGHAETGGTSGAR
jgi:hypothetical protein